MMKRMAGLSTVGLILLIVLLLLLVGALPPLGLVGYGWGPSGLLFVALIVLLVLLLAGKL